MISVRTVLVTLAVAFTAYLTARGLWWTEPVASPVILLLALAAYLATTLLCIFWTPGAPAVADAAASDDDAGSRSAQRRLPLWAAVLSVVIAALVPTAVSFAVGTAARDAGFANWYLGGIGALMTIVMVRRRPWFAWAGILALGVGSSLWMGAIPALGMGLVGSIAWVVVAQIFLRSFDRAASDTARLAQLQRAASAWQAAQVVRQRERRVQVQRALAVAGPVLTRTVASGGELTGGERLEARLAEGRLRDEIRAPRLLDDDVRDELARARRRGASVTVLDEGGLEGIGDEDLTVIRAQVAETLRAAASDRIYIRTSPHDSVAVTIVGRSASSGHAEHGGLTDEDTVDLWREIALPQSRVTDQTLDAR